MNVILPSCCLWVYLYYEIIQKWSSQISILIYPLRAAGKIVFANVNVQLIVKAELLSLNLVLLCLDVKMKGKCQYLDLSDTTFTSFKSYEQLFITISPNTLLLSKKNDEEHFEKNTQVLYFFFINLFLLLQWTDLHYLIFTQCCGFI